MRKLKWTYNQTVNRLLLIVGAILALVFIVNLMERKSKKEVRQILIEIAPLEDSSRLVSEANILTTMTQGLGKSIEGTDIASLDLIWLEQQILERDPFIKDAEVYLDARNRLHIYIEQREPILRIIDGKGINYYLDTSGKKMPLSKNFTARVPVISGYIPAFTPEYQEREGHLIKDIFEIVKLFDEDELMKPLTEQIFVNSRKEFIVIPKLGKQKINFGKFKDFDTKIKRLKIFYDQGMPYEGWQKYRVIDLRFKNQVVCTKA